MIREVLTSKGVAAVTSDQWHVVHSRFAVVRGRSGFARGVFSEHEDRTACQAAAKGLRARLAGENQAVPAEERDEVFVRRPNYKSLKRAKHRRSKPQ
jgi:hypothetical protein